MKISYSRPNERTLLLDLTPDNQDAVPPLLRVHFSAQWIGRLQEPRAALIGYLLVRDLVGNRLVLQGLHVPAFLAGRIQRQRAGFELFIEGVSNASLALAPRLGPRRLAWGVAPAGGASPPAGDDLTIERSDLGYRVRGSGVEAGVLPVRTNLRLFLSMASRTPHEIEAAVTALLAFDMLGASILRLPGSGPDATPDLLDLMGEVGLSVDVGEAAA
jgi:hypothetical protein